MAHASSTSAVAIAPSARDHRVDFFRGLALLFIFIDHVKENTLQYITMQNFGFADAAEVFVALAGYASFLAYTRVFERQGWWAGLLKVANRISKLYLAHTLFLVVCVAVLIAATLVFDNPIYETVLNLEPFFEEPVRALRKALLLEHQPAMLDILPLYIVLLMWFPVLLVLMRVHVLVALAVSVSLWLGANLRGWNLPTYPENEGWFFNPFAWQLLFSLGVFAAFYASKRALPRPSLWLVLPAVGFAVFALLVTAPWTALPQLDEMTLIPTEQLVGEQGKQFLSLWRVAHLIVLAYLVSSLIPASAGWLASPLARRIVDCGRHSLPVFCLGTALSMAGNLAMAKYGEGWTVQIGVNLVGIVLLLLTGWTLAWQARSHERALPSRQG